MAYIGVLYIVYFWLCLIMKIDNIHERWIFNLRKQKIGKIQTGFLWVRIQYTYLCTTANLIFFQKFFSILLLQVRPPTAASNSSSTTSRPSLALAHKMKGLRKDVQEKISRLRSRSAERISNKRRSLRRSSPSEERVETRWDSHIVLSKGLFCGVKGKNMLILIPVPVLLIREGVRNFRLV